MNRRKGSVVRLDVIGSAGSYPGPGRACSSYLVSHDGFHLLLDAGNGSMSNLFSFTTPDLLDVVLLTHEHTDHIADYVGIHHFRAYGSKPKQRLLLYLTKGTLERLSALISDSSISEIAEVRILEVSSHLTVGPFTLSLMRAFHPVETYAVRVTSEVGSVGYTADSGPDPSLAAFFDGVDLLVAESTWLEPNPSAPKGLHLNALEVAELASESGAGRTLISHVAYPNSPYVALENALEYRPGLSMEVAEQGRSYVVSAS